jgi:hypothetical protein
MKYFIFPKASKAAISLLPEHLEWEYLLFIKESLENCKGPETSIPISNNCPRSFH